MVGKNSSGDGFSYGDSTIRPRLGEPGPFRAFVIQWSKRQIDEGSMACSLTTRTTYADHLVNVERQNASKSTHQYRGIHESTVQSLSLRLRAWQDFLRDDQLRKVRQHTGTCCDTPAAPELCILLHLLVPLTKTLNATANPSLRPLENFTQLKASITAVVNVPIMVLHRIGQASSRSWQDDHPAANSSPHEPWQQTKASGLPFVYHV